MLEVFLSLLPYDLLAFTAMGAAWLLTGKVRNFLLAKAVLDAPNERSMHVSPVPRGGGLAVVAVITGGMIPSFFVLPEKAGIPFGFLLAGLFLLTLVSWLDDRKGLGAGIRLATHLLAALIGSFALGENATLFGGEMPFWLDRALLVLGWAWLINLTNFMDGIDGITGAQTLVVSCACGFLLWLADKLFLKTGAATADMILAALMAGSCAGFLLHNWHPARIFLGDVGSVPLGFLTGYLLFKLAVLGYPAAALILPLYYLADSGLTIGRRALKGEKIWLPHRQHFYQRAAAGEGRHDVVVLKVFETDLLLALLAGVSLFYPLEALILAALLVALLLARLHKSGGKVSL